MMQMDGRVNLEEMLVAIAGKRRHFKGGNFWSRRWAVILFANKSIEKVIFNRSYEDEVTYIILNKEHREIALSLIPQIMRGSCSKNNLKTIKVASLKKMDDDNKSH